jgi:hypothetical protein
LAGGMFRSMSSEEQPPRHLERRWATRYSFRAELEIEWGSAVLRGKTRDISSNGMFIESSDTLWAAQVLRRGSRLIGLCRWIVR